jgi:preprotein translocase subunit SecG
METLMSIIIILASVLLIFVVFIQNPKGGGLSSDFGAAQQIGGVQKTNDFIDKATWSLAGVIMVLSIIITIQSKSISKVSNTETPTEKSQDGKPGKTPQTPGGKQ